MKLDEWFLCATIRLAEGAWKRKSRFCFDEVSFECPEMEKGTEVVIDADFVSKTLSSTMKDQQLQKYLL